MSKVMQFLINKDKTIKEAIRQMKQIGEKELFVIDNQDKLYGVLSDGDVRRWILSDGDLNKSVDEACNLKPIHAHENYRLDEIKKIMLDFKIEAIPVVDVKKKIVDVIVWNEIFREGVSIKREKLNTSVVIMAGGKGLRLDPFTRILPKPLIPIGEKPVIEVIIDKFQEYGIKEFFISIGHKSKMIKSYFEEMNDNYNVHFIEEEIPLGTIGGLKLLPNHMQEPILIVNCDTIIEADYAELVKFHCDNQFDLTLVVSYKHYVIPFGVCEIENGGILKKINEKPEYNLLVNTGMYVTNEKTLRLIPDNLVFDAIDLIEKAKREKFKIGVFPISEKSWVDIGQWADYHKAVEKMKITQ